MTPRQVRMWRAALLHDRVTLVILSLMLATFLYRIL